MGEEDIHCSMQEAWISQYVAAWISNVLEKL